MESLSRLGLIKSSLIDYPGEVAAVVFTFGCNLRCPYCHNPELVSGSPPPDLVQRDAVIEYLEKRKSILGGVCITGGEPLMHSGLPALVEKIHSLGLKVKIDTNGTFPEVLPEIKADYIAMDLKTIPGKYYLLGASEKHTAEIFRSLNWIKKSGIPHEFRTTLAKGIAGQEEAEEFAVLLSGADKAVLAQFRPGITLDPAYQALPPTSLEEMKEFQRVLLSKGINCEIRLSGGGGST